MNKKKYNQYKSIIVGIIFLFIYNINSILNIDIFKIQQLLVDDPFKKSDKSLGKSSSVKSGNVHFHLRDILCL